MISGTVLFFGSTLLFFEVKNYFETQQTFNAHRKTLSHKLSISSVDFTQVKKYFENCNDEESKFILQNITNKTSISKSILYRSLSHYCSPLKHNMNQLLDIIHLHHGLNDEDITSDEDFIKLENRALVFRIPFILKKIINLCNYYVTLQLKNKNVIPIDVNHNIYVRYSKQNTKTIIIFSGIIGGRLIVSRMLKYIPDDYNIICTVYEEISSKFYEDVVYDVLNMYNLKDHVVIYSWSYGTLFANSFINKYKHHINIKYKVFCDIFGLPLNTLYMANICGSDNYFEAYRLVKLKIKPFWNRIMMFLLFKSEYIEKRIMTLTLNDYLIWSYENFNDDCTMLCISHDDLMYDVEKVTKNCPRSEIYVFNGGHCSGINRRSLNLLKQKLSLL